MNGLTQLQNICAGIKTVVAQAAYAAIHPCETLKKTIDAATVALKMYAVFCCEAISGYETPEPIHQEQGKIPGQKMILYKDK